VTKHADVEVSGQTVMFDQTQIKQFMQAAEQAWYACPHQTCLIFGRPNEQNNAHQTREQKKLFNKLFDRKFDGLQILSNTTKHNPTATNMVAKR